MSKITDSRCPSDAGWPRLKCTHVPAERHRLRLGWSDNLRLPVPWINGTFPERHGDWLTFPHDRSVAAYARRLCVVCGENMSGAIVFGSAVDGDRVTAGPGGHPRCLWLAANTCPNLLDPDKMIVAWLYVGGGRGHITTDPESPYDDGHQSIDPIATPLTRDELRALARRDPLGVLSAPRSVAT